MATQLSLDKHLAALRDAGATMHAAAARAGLDAKVPTCPSWDVRKLVAHQGMVHRWAAANLRGERDHDTNASMLAAQAAPDLLTWFTDGLDALVDVVASVPDDVEAAVFLKDAPPPRRFWARRQAHETTIHGVDAISATLARWPTSDDVRIGADLAADGIDELLTGFITRGKGKLHTNEPCALLVRAEDTGHAWTVRFSDGPIVTTLGAIDDPDAVFSGTATQLYLTLWNRADDVTATGRADLIDLWRSNIRIRWS